MIPDDIEGSNSKLIYLHLRNSDEPKEANQISAELNINMTSLLPILRRMCDNEYLEKHTGRGYDITN